MTQYYRAPAITRAVHIVEHIANCSEKPRLSELAEHFQLSKSTIHGILHTLLDVKWLNKEGSGRYSLHENFLRIFQKSYEKWDILHIAKPFMLEMRKKVDESVFLGVQEGDYVLIKECIDGSKEMSVRAKPGAKIPLLAGALGKVFLAGMPESELENFLTKQTLPEYTRQSITSVESMKEELGAVRQRGFAEDNEEYLRGVRAIASSIYCKGSTVAALWVAGFTSQMTDEVMDLVQSELTYASNIISNLLSTTLDLEES